MRVSTLSGLLLPIALTACIDSPATDSGGTGTAGGKADGTAATYQCIATGSFTNIDHETAEIGAENIKLEVGQSTCIVQNNQVDCNSLDPFGGEMPWRMSLTVATDAGHHMLQLSLGAPVQNAEVGHAVAAVDSSTIGFVLDSTLEALCQKAP